MTEEQIKALGELGEKMKKPKEVASDIIEVLKKHDLILEKDGEVDYNISIGEVLGLVTNSIREEAYSLPEFYIEKSVNHAVGEKFALKYDPLLKSIYDKLSDENYDPDWGGDTRVELIKAKDETRKVLFFSDQNMHFLAIWDGKNMFKNIHIRRVWFDLPSDEDMDEWIERDERYTDCVKGNHYCSRPNLAWYEKKNFELEYNDPTNKKLENDVEFNYRSYGDGRDKGYVLSTGMGYGLFDNRIDDAIGSYYMIRRFFLDTQSCAFELGLLNDID